MSKTQVFYEFNEELESLWSDFESEADFLPFQSYEWQRYWNTEVGQSKYKIDVCIVVCLVDDRVRAIFPFGTKRAGLYNIMFSMELVLIPFTRSVLPSSLTSPVITTTAFQNPLTVTVVCEETPCDGW